MKPQLLLSWPLTELIAVRQPDQNLANRSIPVFSIGIGGTDPARNISVQLSTGSPTAFPGQDTILNAAIKGQGSSIGSQTELHIRNAAGEVIHQETVTIAESLNLPIPVRLPDTAETQVWTATLASISNEVTEADNSSAASIQIVDRPLRLIVIEGQPFWDTSFCCTLLASRCSIGCSIHLSRWSKTIPRWNSKR